MFYTKYRPQKFSEISVPNEAAQVLSKQVASKKTVHAYLFVGPRGVGKTTTARILAKALNCGKVGKDGDPCGRCSVCKSIQEGIFPDLIEIDAASNRGIDDIRELKGKVRLAPTAGRVKFYIIDEVHMLTAEAFNALLKTLEEPPKNTVFVLCTTEIHKVPETVRSRCQLFRFKRATSGQLMTRLRAISKSEGAKLPDVSLERIAEASSGGFRDAETLLQQVLEGEIKVDSLLSTTSKESFRSLVDALWQKKPSAALDLLNESYERGVDLYVWAGEFLKYLRDLLIVKSTGETGFVEASEEVLRDLLRQSKRIETAWIVKVLEEFMEAHSRIKSSFVPQMPLEIVIVKICGSVVDGSADVGMNYGGPLDGACDEKDNFDAGAVNASDSEEKSGSVIEKSWPSIISKISGINSSIGGLLKNTVLSKTTGKFLVLDVYYAFHKERLESSKNRKIIEDVLKEILGKAIRIECNLKKDRPKVLADKEIGVLTDFNVAPVPNVPVLEMFDGELPL